MDYVALFNAPPPLACHTVQISEMIESGEEQVNRCTITGCFPANDDEEALFLAREIASGKKIKRGDEEWKLTRLFAVAHEVKLDVPLLVER
jgi:hypothetical protein